MFRVLIDCHCLVMTLQFIIVEFYFIGRVTRAVIILSHGLNLLGFDCVCIPCSFYSSFVLFYFYHYVLVFLTVASFS